MGFKRTASSGGTGEGFEAPPEGNHQAVCVALVELGTHETKFGDKKQIYLAWELVDEQMSGMKFNHVIGIQMTDSLSQGKSQKSALRKLVEDWFGKEMADGTEFDLGTLLGRSCLLNVKYTDESKKYVKVAGVSPLHKSMKPKPPLREPFAFERPDRPCPLEHFPDWLPYIYGSPVAQVVADCKEWKGKGVPAAKPAEVAAMEERFGGGGDADEGDLQIPF